ncbi:Na+/H+ antiporter subunit B [Catalinimonas sp. 4WD22]|uniref:Na+/H+ antiporter subunit B n=1 Tax=Catalinimonas locisalis TaxID=3133978 RepID=UPI003101322F
MRTVILSKAISILLPVFIMISVYVFFRGHNQPGGGFIAALIASIGFILHMMAFGIDKTQKKYRINAFMLIGSGLLSALSAALLPLFLGQHFLEGMWVTFNIPLIGKVGTPTLFDLGVYLLVIGITLKIAFNLFENSK